MFKFEPIIQAKLWGGSKIARLKGISDRNDIGESWEISGVEGFETVVAEGPYRGMPLNRLVATLKEQLVGRSVYQRHGNQFPLLFKFIDACDDLSIQVHPDDEAARRYGLQSGKTEMWYVLSSAPGARLYNGLAVQTDAEGLRQMVADKTIMQALAQYEISEGDVFFIPAGRIHAIGAGCMVAEIQQTSDTTYRLYDYDRRDRDGHLRPLHIEQAPTVPTTTCCPTTAPTTSPRSTNRPRSSAVPTSRPACCPSTALPPSTAQRPIASWSSWPSAVRAPSPPTAPTPLPFRQPKPFCCPQPHNAWWPLAT